MEEGLQYRLQTSEAFWIFKLLDRNSNKTMQEGQHRRICKEKQAAHKVHLLEVSGVLLVVLVQLLQPARGGARQRGSCRGRTSTSTSASVLRR